MIQDIAVEDIIPRGPRNDERIAEITPSIREIGLLHSITVIEEADHKYRIKAGDKRFYACIDVGHKTVPCLVLPHDMPEEQIKEIHLHENLRRANLEWWAIVEMERELHELRQAQKGVGRQGRKQGWSLRDTAEELGMGFGNLSEDIKLAEACAADPNLRKIKDKVTAKRLILQKANRMSAEDEALGPVRFEVNTCHLGDASEILKYFQSSTFDVCFTDPPWLEYKDKSLTKDDKTLPVFKEIFRVLKHGSFMYVICSTPDFVIYQTELAKIGFQVSQMPIIWHKQNVISHGTKSWEYGRDYEPILLAVKGNPVLAIAVQPSSVFTCPAVHPTRLIHPNEKPVEVPMHFLNHCSYEGSLVLDPFGGSGVTAEACRKLGRRYVVIEREKKFFDRIEQRLLALNTSNPT
jgi:DNA modification methylase